MSRLKESIENNIALWTATIAIAGFLAGFKANEVILDKIARSSAGSMRSNLNPEGNDAPTTKGCIENPTPQGSNSGASLRITQLEEENKKLRTACLTPQGSAEKSEEATIERRNHDISAQLDLNGFCGSKFGSDFQGTPGPNYSCSNGSISHVIELADACSWQAGSRDYQIDPLSLTVTCDSTESTEHL